MGRLSMMSSSPRSPGEQNAASWKLSINLAILVRFCRKYRCLCVMIYELTMLYLIVRNLFLYISFYLLPHYLPLSLLISLSLSLPLSPSHFLSLPLSPSVSTPLSLSLSPSLSLPISLSLSLPLSPSPSFSPSVSPSPSASPSLPLSISLPLSLSLSLSLSPSHSASLSIIPPLSLFILIQCHYFTTINQLHARFRQTQIIYVNQMSLSFSLPDYLPFFFSLSQSLPFTCFSLILIWKILLIYLYR